MSTATAQITLHQLHAMIPLDWADEYEFHRATGAVYRLIEIVNTQWEKLPQPIRDVLWRWAELAAVNTDVLYGDTGLLSGVRALREINEALQTMEQDLFSSDASGKKTSRSKSLLSRMYSAVRIAVSFAGSGRRVFLAFIKALDNLKEAVLDAVERNDPAYQARLQEALQEVLHADIEQMKKNAMSNPNDIRAWLDTL